jgi:hypothetical protein
MCWERIGALVLPGAACLDSGLTERVDLCFDEYIDDDRAFCIRRLADDAELWFVTSANPVLDTGKWAQCESTKGNPKPLPPPPCFAAACPELNVSLPQTHVASGCSEAETKNYFSCGVVDPFNVNAYDENCCPRRPCTDVTGCEAGEECRPVFIRDAQFCLLVDSVDDESDELVCSCNLYEGSNAVEQLFCVPETY